MNFFADERSLIQVNHVPNLGEPWAMYPCIGTDNGVAVARISPAGVCLVLMVERRGRQLFAHRGTKSGESLDDVLEERMAKGVELTRAEETRAGCP
jgi:hypothetical protein